MDAAFAIAAGVVGAPVLVTAVNIAQNYVGAGPAGAEVGGKPASALSAADLEALNKARLRRLFEACDAPTVGELAGEWRAVLLAGGIMGPLSRLYTHKVFGPGRWVGKGFPPPGGDPVGYNLFDGPAGTARVRLMSVEVGASSIVSGASLLVDYRPHNRGSVGTMRDELRRVNERLYLGMGYMGIGGGALNPAPFALVGPPGPFVGADPS